MGSGSCAVETNEPANCSAMWILRREFGGPSASCDQRGRGRGAVALAGYFAALYPPIGWPSTWREKLRAMLLKAFYSTRSERLLIERLWNSTFCFAGRPGYDLNALRDMSVKRGAWATSSRDGGRGSPLAAGVYHQRNAVEPFFDKPAPAVLSRDLLLGRRPVQAPHTHAGLRVTCTSPEVNFPRREESLRTVNPDVRPPRGKSRTN